MKFVESRCMNVDVNCEIICATVNSFTVEKFNTNFDSHNHKIKERTYNSNLIVELKEPLINNQWGLH